MATNLLIGYPDYPFSSQSIASSASASSTKPLANMVTGPRGEGFELASTTDSDLWFVFDPGSAYLSCNYGAILRADLLQASGVRYVNFREGRVNFLSGVAPFTGLSGWFDSTRGVAKTASDFVAQLNDLSGNARHVTSASDATSPTWLTPASGVNDSGALDFNDTDNLLASGTGFTIAQPLTVCMALKVDAANAGRYVFTAAGATQCSIRHETNWLINAGSNADTGLAVAPGTYVITAIYNNTSSKFYLNGTQYGGSLSPGTDGLNGFCIGNNAPGPTVAFDGKICEVMVYPSALSDSDRGDVENYLTDKWLTARAGGTTSFNSATLYNPRSEDYYETFTDTGSARMMYVQMGGLQTGVPSGSQSTSASFISKFPFNKLYMGASFDFGTDPIYPRVQKREPRSARARDSAYSFTFTWKGVRNTTRNSFVDKIVQYKDTNPLILYTASYHDILNEHRIIHCMLKDVNIDVEQFNLSSVTATFEEII